MAALHSALQALSPLDFADVPSRPDELDAYLSDVFTKAELILESVPPPAPEDASPRPRSATASSLTSSASEMSSSSARSLPPSPAHIALQKEWGKAIKVGGKDNPLNIPVYKCSGKDGRGAWFARRSVHEGLGFARFKRGLEREFPETMKVQGAPGEGNIRGIGGEKRVEEIAVEGKGRVEVYYLSAQFPGPTTPRDFVTFLVTSSKAMAESHRSEIPELAPRHYMILSKPCTHPECPPKDGMVRGQYESVEFIREIPRRPKKTMSWHDLQNFGNDRSGRRSPNLEHEALMRRTGQMLDAVPYLHENRSASDLSPRRTFDDASARQVSRSPSGRARGATVGFPDGHTDGRHYSIYDDYDPEANPVEWIMVTRSDPGGGIPRFMVERGTPGSIVADAYKFLNWATQQDEEAPQKRDERPPMPTDRRASFESWRANGTLAGISEHDPRDESDEPLAPSLVRDGHDPEPLVQSSILANVTGALSSTLHAYAPQAVLDRLNGASTLKPAPPSVPAQSAEVPAAVADDDDNNDDAASSISSTSFASADSHLGETDGSPSLSSSLTSPSKEKNDKSSVSAHDRELQKLADRRAALDKKLLSSRDKLIKDTENQTAKEKDALKKAEEKHDKELKKQEEKYKKEVARLEAKKEKEAKKIEERKKRQADKDEKVRLTRERDEAREELEMLKKEREIWQKQVGDLQKENTRLVARVGKLEGMDPNPRAKGLVEADKVLGRSRSGTAGSAMGGRSRSASLRKVTPPLSP